MPRSRTTSPLLDAFGGVLKHLHTAHEEAAGKKLSHDALARSISARMAKRVGPSLRLGGTTLWRWEAGEVKSPDPLVLRELGDVYGVGFDALLAVLEENLKNPKLTVDDGLRILRDLLRHERDQASDPYQGGSDVPASAEARILELERKHAAAATAMQDVIFKLTQTLKANGVSVPYKSETDRTRKSRPRARARKAV